MTDRTDLTGFTGFTSPTGMPLSSDLLEHAGALRRLARGILGDAHAAEDVVQETWVRALERPPARAGRDGTLSGWLASVARSLALRKKRGDARRDAREAAAPPAADARGLQERRRALASLTDAVLALDEPYQSAILLRFYDDLPPRAAAARLGVPVATFKSRTARGLAKLREHLDAELGAEDDPTALFRALAFLALPATPVAPEPGSSSPAGTGAAAAAAGAIAMGVQGKIAAALAAAALVGFAAVRGFDRGAEPANPSVEQRGDAAARPDAALSEADADHLEDAATDELGHSGERLAAAPAVVDAGEPLVEDPYELVIEGRVTDDDDLPVADAVVYAAPLGVARNVATRTDADGRFRVSWRGPTPTAEVALSAFRDGDGSILRRVRATTAGTQVAFRLVPEAFDVVVSWGVSGDGSDQASLDLAAPQEPARALAVLSSAAQGADRPTWTPEMVPTGEHTQAFALWPGECPSSAMWLDDLTILDSIETPVQARWALTHLRAGLAEGPQPADEPTASAFEGVVRDAAGEPVPRALVALGSAPGRGDGPRTTSDDRGAFAFEELDPGVWYARAGGGPFGLDALELSIPEGAAGGQRWDPWLDRGRELRGELVDAETGAPQEGWIVTAIRGDEELDSAATDPTGRFRIPNAGRDAVRLLARPKDAKPGAERVIASALLPRVVGDEPPPTFAVDRAFDADGIVFALRDDGSRARHGAEVRAWNLDTGFAVTGRFDDDGVCRIGGPLPAGLWELEVLAPGRAARTVGPLRIAGPGAVDLDAIALDEPSVVRVRQSGDEDADERWVATVWRLFDEARVLERRTVGRLPDKLHLPAGRYALELTPNAEHPVVADLLERDRAPEGSRLSFEAGSGDARALAIERTAAGAALALVQPPPPAARVEAEPSPEQLDAQRAEAFARVTEASLHDVFQTRSRCAKCH